MVTSAAYFDAILIPLRNPKDDGIGSLRSPLNRFGHKPRHVEAAVLRWINALAAAESSPLVVRFVADLIQDARASILAANRELSCAPLGIESPASVSGATAPTSRSAASPARSSTRGSAASRNPTRVHKSRPSAGDAVGLSRGLERSPASRRPIASPRSGNAMRLNDTLHLPGPLEKHCVARNRNAAPVRCKGWFADASPQGRLKTLNDSLAISSCRIVKNVNRPGIVKIPIDLNLPQEDHWPFRAMRPTGTLSPLRRLGEVAVFLK